MMKLPGNIHVFIASDHASSHMNDYNGLFSFMMKSKWETCIIKSYNFIPNLQEKDTECYGFL
jgi:hypothetical protein